MTTTRVLIWLLATASACTTGAATSSDAHPTGGDDAGVVDAPPFTKGVSTLAGAGAAGAVDGDRDVARFANPVNVLLGASGTIYVADFDNGRIRTLDGVGHVSTLIAQPGFQRPFGLTLTADGTLYVETDNDANGVHSTTSGTVWRVAAGAHTASVVATKLGRPRGLAALADGRIAMTDYQHHVVELLDPATGHVTVLAGTFDAAGYLDAAGAAARFSSPYGIAVRADGRLVIADYGNHRLRLVDVATGATSTLAGDGTLVSPQGVAIDASGDIYITDSGAYRVRRIRGSIIDTIAGDGVAGYRDADDRLAAELYGLEGLAVSRDGARLYVADGTRGDDVPYNRVRLVDMTP